MKARSIADTVELNNGVRMPVFGFGTWKMSDDEATMAVSAALAAGYRLIDTAKLYGNEHGVGKAVRESCIPREEIFVTTKLWPSDFFRPEQGFKRSLETLGFEYVDLYLIHWPIPLMPQSVWLALEKMYEQKLARAIGVSNYAPGDLAALSEYGHVAPAVNQIKCSPFDHDKETLADCTKRGIAVEAYSPLTKGRHLHDERVARIAQRCGKTPAQIMLRWCLQKGTIPIPKSSRPERIKENADIFDFEIDAADMEVLDDLS